MSPLYVRPYVKVHKNDDRVAEAIAEAATRPTMLFVTIKPEEQLDLQALRRAREPETWQRHQLATTERMQAVISRFTRPVMGIMDISSLVYLMTWGRLLPTGALATCLGFRSSRRSRLPASLH